MFSECGCNGSARASEGYFNRMLPETHEAKNAPVWPAVSAAALVVLAWVVNLVWLTPLAPEDRGTFGDMFGAANSIFSGLAFVGVVYAIFLQRFEVAIAKKEISYTKSILDKQQDQLELQNQETRKQIFESTFFQLLRLFTNLTNQIDIKRRGGEPYEGKDAFPYFLRNLHAHYKHPQIEEEGVERFMAAYVKFYRSYKSDLGHYFRTLYNIVKFIDNSDIANKKFYSNILRAQLSDVEVAILFHNGLSPFGREKFKPLIERYALLKMVNDEDLVDISLKKRYAPSAFGEDLPQNQHQ